MMTMNVIARRNLEDYWRWHSETEQPLRTWLMAARANNWQSMNDVLRTYSTASPVGAERCVFNICGNKHRLIVAFKFTARVAFIKFIGTHAEYDRVDARTVSQF